MDATAQWPQNIGVRDMTRTSCEKVGGEKAAPPPQKQQGLNCPRCNSTNTKFCYYNNYSLSQPRYFCKTCRRYWTSGGTLRNIPVGGGSRKNKRPSAAAASPTTTSSKQSKPNPPDQPKFDLRTDGHDLNLTFSRGFTMTPPGYVGPTQDLVFLNPPVLNFDGCGLGAGGSTFTFQDLKHQAPSAGASAIDGQDHQSGDGYWSGVLGGGGAW